MKTDTNYIWTKICNAFSNEIQSVQDNYAELNSEQNELFEMIKNDIQSIDNTSYMYDDDTNQAWDVLHKNIVSQERKTRRLFNFEHNTLLKIAASIILLIGFSWITYSILNQSKFETIQTSDFQVTQTLPDGTIVYLNANSKIEYPKQFALNTREVKLSGEAFFDVARDVKCPFIITAKETQIEVLGTSFNVNAKNNNDKVEVLVKSGVVRLSILNNNEKLVLTKGQFGFSQNNSLNRNKIDDLNYLSWKTKRIDFNEAPLAYVINILNQTYTSNIIISDEVSSAYKLNAKFDKAPLDTVLKSICLAFDLNHDKIRGKIQLVNKPK